MNENENIKTNGKYSKLFVNYIKDLNEWFERATNNNRDYVVAMNYRCFNLLYLTYGNKKEFEKVLAENALLMQVQNIAKYYVENKKFPSIFLLDDVIYDGARLSVFLDNFYKMLYSHIITIDSTFDDEKKLFRDFYSNVNINAFSVRNFPILIRQEHQWSISCQMVAADSECREIVYNIYDTIAGGNVSNTVYSITAIKEKKEEENIKNAWISIPTSDNISEVYLHPLSLKYNVYPMVCSYKNGIYTPYFFTNKLSFNQINKISATIKEYLLEQKEDELKKLALLLDKTCKKETYNVCFELVYLLLSQITLKEFIKDYNMPISNFSFDIEKIAHNFGYASDIKPLLNAFMNLDLDSNFLEEIVKIANTEADKLEEGCKKDEVLQYIKKVIYEEAIRREETLKIYAYKYASGGYEDSYKLKNNLERGIGVSEVLSNIKKNDRPKALAYLTWMDYIGDINLKPFLLDDEFYPTIEVTEMTLGMLPKDLQPYFYKVFDITQFFWRNDDLLERMECYMSNIPNIELEYIEKARDYGEEIIRHRSVVNEMLNWRCLYK